MAIKSQPQSPLNGRIFLTKVVLLDFAPFVAAAAVDDDVVAADDVVASAVAVDDDVVAVVGVVDVTDQLSYNRAIC